MLEPDDKEFTKENKPNYIVGKWYKINNCWWGKYTSCTSITFHGSESISAKGIYCNNNFNANIKEQNNSFVLLTDLSEIQQYLPDGHPDKQKNKYDYEAVHCTTQEEWDFVISKFNSKNLVKSTYDTYKSDSCITFNGKTNSDIGCYTGKDWYLRNKGLVISFSEWCNKFNHSPDFLKQNIPMKEEEFKAGNWVTLTSEKYSNIRPKTTKITKIENNEEIWCKDFVGESWLSLKMFKEHHRKALLEEIPTENLSNDEILFIAKQYYPIGTKFYSAQNKDREYVVKSNSHKLKKSVNGNYYNIDVDNVPWIYFDKQWAKIISSPIENKEETFVLPERWCVALSKDNLKILEDWRRQGENSLSYGGCIGFLCSDKIWRKENENFFIISFDQFKKYVLKENNSIFPVEQIQNRIEELKQYPLTPEECISNGVIIPKVVKRTEKANVVIKSSNFVHVNIPVNVKPKPLVKSIKIQEFSITI